MANKCKFEKTQLQVSYDSGATWQDVDPAQYGKGELLEFDSVDCSSLETIYRWRTLEGQYVCDGNNKYVKEIRDESYDNGVTWYVSYPTVYRDGQFVGVDNIFCCDKFVGHYELARDSSDTCPRYYKWNGYRCVYIDPLKVVKCNGSSTLTSGETKYYQTGYTLVEAEITNNVTTIGTSAFTNCSGLTEIVIPNSVTNIGERAFYGCSGLTSCTIPNSVTTIGSWVFGFCSGLTSCTIPNSVTTIGGNAFQYCTSLEKIDVPNSVTAISGSAFQNCTSLTSVTIQTSTTTIGSHAFENCTSLDSITCLAVTPPSLGSSAFRNTNNCPIYVQCGSLNSYYDNWYNYGDRLEPISPCDEGTILKFKATYSNSTTYSATCDGDSTLTTATTRPSGYQYTAMTSINIGYCVTSIGFRAFYDCDSLKSVRIPRRVTTIGDSAFNSCGSLSSVTIPDSVTSLGGGAFGNCTGLTSIIIPHSVTSIGSSAFENCTSLSSVTISNGVTSIGNYAFQGCERRSMTFDIPSSVTTIGNCALGFGDPYSNATQCILYVRATTPPTLPDGKDAFWTGHTINGVKKYTKFVYIYVPRGTVNDYKNANGWSAYSDVITFIP